MISANLKTNQCVATCPTCGLLCDDVLIGKNEQQIKVLGNGCTKSVTFFEQTFNDTMPQINGKQVSLQQAIAKIVKLLKVSQRPLLTGISTDVQGFRSLYNLSQKMNASLQHMNAASMMRNMRVIQSTGWQTTTLTEVKNRADVMVCIGTDVITHNPRFFERFIRQDGMFIEAKKREVIFIGENIQKNDALEAAWILPCRAVDLPEITLVLRALVAGKTLKAMARSVKINDLQAIADKLKQAKYAVLAWIAKDFDLPHAELTIQNITETVAILNNTTRAAGLSLGGSDGDTSANNANTWLSGLALNDAEFEHDCVIWVNSFSPEKLPPKSKMPLIVLGNSNCQFETVPDVFIPIATPGLDSSGTLFRIDSSVMLPLKKLHDNNLPTLSEVILQIEAQLK